MSISFSGLASGLDTDSWVSALTSVKQLSVTTLQNQLTSLKNEQSTVSGVKSAFTKLQTALQVLTDSKLGNAADIFAANKVTSSDTSLFTASVTSEAVRDTYDIVVKQLATTTTAQAQEHVSKVADENTRLADLGVAEGSVTVYIDGIKSTINIDKNDTVANLQSRLSTAGATLSIDEDSGIMTIAPSSSGSELKIGANTDTSNFVSLFGLLETEEGTYESAIPAYQAHSNSILTDANAGFKELVKEGTFTIGSATFTIDSTTTLDGLISQINNNADSNVFASWDSSKGVLVLKSTVEGASHINVQAGTSNFTDVMGLTESEWDADGNLTSCKMITDAQTLGNNAKVLINGTEVTSTSNTVTADLSRIAGLTINLKDTTKEGDKSGTLVIEQDTGRLSSALKDIVSAYNELMLMVDEKTGVEGDLHGETSLKSIYNTLRSTMNSNNVNDGSFSLLSQIGITTAEASAALSDDNVSLTLNEDKLKEVLANNGDSVKELLIGDTGIITQIKSNVDNALFSGGYFSTKEASIKTEVSNMNKKITKRQESVDTYKARLENKFSAMEQVISKLNTNYSSLMNSSGI